MASDACAGCHGQLDPQIATVLRQVKKAAQPHYWQLTPQQARIAHAKASRVLQIGAQPVYAIEPLTLASTSAQVDASIAARLYYPSAPNWAAPLPVLIWFHGGGFMVGSVDTAEPIARMFCAQAGCAVLSVDYRLAPEHRFPTAFDDAFAALRWLVTDGHAMGLDAQRIAVGGDSAGGTLAAACALAARDQGIALALQLLVYPGVSAHQDTPSHQRYADGYLLSQTTIQWFFSHYLNGPADRLDFRFAPLLAARHDRLAPAWIAVAEFDPLLDEGVAYAQALRSAGTACELRCYPGMVHAFFDMGAAIDVARRAHADAVRALRAALIS